MGFDITCDIDSFAKSVESIIDDVDTRSEAGVSRAVEQSTRKGVRLLRNKYAVKGKHAWSDEYRKGFASNITRDGHVSTGEIGNKNKPGLVHLLEKGHCTLTGRRTIAYPHMDPTFNDMQEDFIKRAEKAIEEALG